MRQTKEILIDSDPKNGINSTIVAPTSVENNDLPGTPKYVLVRDEVVKQGVDFGLKVVAIAPPQYEKKNRLYKGSKPVLDGSGNHVLKFDGLKPSFIDKNGLPHPLDLATYRKRTPTASEHKKWFANSNNRVGVIVGDECIPVSPTPGATVTLDELIAKNPAIATVETESPATVKTTEVEAPTVETIEVEAPASETTTKEIMDTNESATVEVGSATDKTKYKKPMIATESLLEFTGGYNCLANKQLELVGYRRAPIGNEKEKVFVRVIDANGAAQSLTMQFPLTTEDIIKLENYNKRGYGIYVVVNGWGHADKFIRDCKAAFFEFDNMSLDDQLEIVEKYNLPYPTLQINTGGKSIHQYYVFTTPPVTPLWTELQLDIIHLFKGCDKALKNPSRVLRLSGFDHQKTGRKAEIVTIGEKIDFDTLRSLIPERPREVKELETEKKRQISSNRGYIEDVLLEFETSLRHARDIHDSIKKLKPDYILDIVPFLNPISRGVLAGECRISSSNFETLPTEPDQEYPICAGSLNGTYRNTGEDIRGIIILFEVMGLDVDEDIALELFRRMESLTEFREASYYDDVWRYFNEKRDCKPGHLSAVIKQIINKLNSDYSKLLKPESKDDDLMDIALNTPTPDTSDEETLTPEEIEARKLDNIERYNKIATSVKDLKIDDNLDLFDPPLSKHVKNLLDEKQVRGGSRAVALTGCTLMSAVSPFTRTILKSNKHNADRPALLYVWNIAESGSGKGHFGYNPVELAKTFFKQLDEFSLNKDISFLQREIFENGNEELKQDFETNFKVKLKNSGTITDLDINTKFQYNFSNSKEGGSHDVGNQLAAQRLNKKHREYFKGLYSHPQAIMRDELEKFAEKIYGSNNEIYLNTVDLCELKEGFNNNNPNKKLTGGTTVVGSRPVVFCGNITDKSALTNLSTEKQSQYGFSGRLILNYQAGKEFEMETDAIIEIPKNTPEKNKRVKLTDEQCIQLLFLGSTICNHIEALIKTKDNLNYQQKFYFTPEAYQLYVNTYNPGGIIHKISDELKTNYPDWSSLIDNMRLKNWQIIFDVAPNLKRLNWGIENFLNRLEIIYPGRKLDDFVPLLEVSDNGDDLIKFAKVLVAKLPDGFKYVSDLEETLTLDGILKPNVIDANGKDDPIELICPNTDLYSYAYESTTFDCFSPIEYVVTGEDMKRAIDIAVNSLRSFGNFLAATRLSGLLDDRKNLAQQARDTHTLRYSISESGEMLRLEDLFDFLRKRYEKNNIKFTIAEIVRMSSKLEAIETFLPRMIDRIVELGHFIKAVGKNKKNCMKYEIVKIPTYDEIKKLAMHKL